MNGKHTKLYKFIIKPPLGLCVAVWVLFLLAAAASTTLYFSGLGLRPWAFAAHVGTLVFFLASLYAVLAVIGVPRRAIGSRGVRRFFADYGFRAKVIAAASIIFNALYAVFGIAIAIVEHSPWLGALVGYHILLAAARAVIFIFVGSGGDSDAELRRLRAYSYCGVMLVLLALAIVPVIRLVIDDRNTYRYFVSAITYVSAIALYAFIKLGVAIRNFRKAHKTDDMSLIAIKNISLADALITIFALQATMVKELGDTALGVVMNPVVGAAVAFTVFSFGVYMFVDGMRRIKNRKAVAAENGKKE